MARLHFKLRKNGITKGLSSNVGAIRDEEYGVVGQGRFISLMTDFHTLICEIDCKPVPANTAQAGYSKILFDKTVFMQAASQTTKPKLYNPRHPERTLLHQPLPSITRLEQTRPAQASLTGRAICALPSPICAGRLPDIWSAAFSPTVLPAPATLTSRTTNSWPSPAKAEVSASHATPGAWQRRQST